jgi:hypothetical protein
MTTAARSWLLASLIASGAACSGSGAATPSYTLIDDMEGDVNRLAWPPPAGTMPGRWVGLIDCTQGDRVAPPPYYVDPGVLPYEALPASQETLPGVTSTRALRLRTTTPIAGVYGASTDAFLATTTDGPLDPGTPPADAPCRRGTPEDFPAPTIDLTAYTGITFWARGASSVGNRMRVLLADQNTDPRGGVCNPAHSVQEDGCYNSFGATIVLTDTFTRYTVDFATLAQDPIWGYQVRPAIPDVAHAYGLTFMFEVAHCALDDSPSCAGDDMPLSFDLWLDDLYFVNRP